jgi:hypothetical protein
MSMLGTYKLTCIPLYILLVTIWYTYYMYLTAYNAPVNLSLLLSRLRLVPYIHQ